MVVMMVFTDASLAALGREAVNSRNDAAPWGLALLCAVGLLLNGLTVLVLVNAGRKSR